MTMLAAGPCCGFMRALQFGLSSLHHCRRPVALVVFLDSALGYIMSSVGMSQVGPQLHLRVASQPATLNPKP